jgi:pimeloyl-ACP methyl ester carboxylesterase
METTDTSIHVNGVELFGTVTGSGEPLVLVHGAWTDHTTWRGIVPALSESFLVVAYDRRGHSRSRSAVDGPRVTHEDDLAALVETLELGPVHLVGSSYGALISLGLAGRRPDLVRSIVAHEPPAVTASPAPALVRDILEGVGDQVRSGDAVGGAHGFVEQVLGEGMWDRLPEDLRRAIVANAPTYVAMVDDPHCLDVDVQSLWRHHFPILLTDGSETPTWLREIVDPLAAAIGGVRRHTFAGAGHMPHGTHPEELVATILRSCGG